MVIKVIEYVHMSHETTHRAGADDRTRRRRHRARRRRKMSLAFDEFGRPFIIIKVCVFLSRDDAQPCAHVTTIAR